MTGTNDVDGHPLPGFLVIGAQKGGTHWIRDNLSAHPDVFMPGEELHFFTRPAWIEAHGIDGYRTMFGGWNGEPVVGEATPGYMAWKHAPATMARSIDALLPDVRLVAVLRDPVDRALSALAHFRRLGVVEADDTDLLQVIRGNLPLEDHALGLVANGWYGAILAPYMDRFGDRLLVVLNDDLARDAAQVYDQMLGHLGLGTGFRPPGLEIPRFSFDPRRFGVEPLTPGARAAVFEYFEDDVVALEQLIGRDLDAWRPSSGVAAPGADAPPVARNGAATAGAGASPAVGARPDPEGPGPQASAPGLLLGRGEARLLDLGCGSGDSLVVAQARFGVPGIGIDRRTRNVERARARGLSAYQGDLLALDPADFPAVEYVHLDNVLDQLPSLADVDVVIGFALRVASRQIVIHHPSFEDADYLADLGLALCWAGRPSIHPTPVRLHELVRILNGHGAYGIAIVPRLRIWDSTSPSVLPLDASPDESPTGAVTPPTYQPEVHGPKPTRSFDRPVFSSFELVVTRAGDSGPVASGAVASSAAGRAPDDWARRLATAADGAFEVVERPNGTTVVVEADMVRPIASPLVARALGQRYGVTARTRGELADLLPGPPVVLLKTPGESAFVVVGGRRLPVPGMGVMVHTDHPWYASLETEPPLEVLRAAADLHEERRRRSQ